MREKKTNFLIDKWSVVLMGATLLFGVNLFVGHWLLGSLCLVVWMMAATRYLLLCPWFADGALERVFFGWLALGSVMSVLLSSLYLLVGAPPWLGLVVLLASSLALNALPKDSSIKITSANYRLQPWSMLVLVADIFILGIFLLARTDASVISPWNLVGPEVFFLFFVATLILIRKGRTLRGLGWWLPSVLHLFTAVSVAGIVFGIGFGFDPFVHRAAEEALASTGSIEPRQVLYAGQYVLVAVLHQMTSISVRLLDIWMLPVGASIFLPLATYIGLRDGWGLDSGQAKAWLWCALLIPFTLATFTVPFTVTYVFFLGVLFLYPATLRRGISLPASLSLCLAALACVWFHPLLAVPTLLILAGGLLWSRCKSVVQRWTVSISTSVAIALSVPAMLVAFAIQSGDGVYMTLPWDRMQTFFRLFKSPYGHPFPYIPVHLEILYDLRYWLPMLLPLLAVTVVCTVRSIRESWMGMYASIAAGLFVSILLVSTSFAFKDIISHEQGEFALRLLQAWFVLALPVVAVGVSRLSTRFASTGLVLSVALALLVTISWYFSYPQFNAKYPFFAPSVGQDDIDIVHELDRRAQKEPYLVLSNQMTSAAALQEFGFAHYLPLHGEEVLWYPIPTGGELYTYYMELVRGHTDVDRLSSLAGQTGAKRIFYVTHSYWPWRPGYLDTMEASADDRFSLGEGRVVLFEYNFN